MQMVWLPANREKTRLIKLIRISESPRYWIILIGSFRELYIGLIRESYVRASYFGGEIGSG